MEKESKEVEELEVNGVLVNRFSFIIETSAKIMAGLVGNMKKVNDKKIDGLLQDHALTSVSAAEHLWDALSAILLDDCVCNECKEKECGH